MNSSETVDLEQLYVIDIMMTDLIKFHNIKMDMLEKLKHDIMEKVKDIKLENEIVKKPLIPLVNNKPPAIFSINPQIPTYCSVIC